MSTGAWLSIGSFAIVLAFCFGFREGRRILRIVFTEHPIEPTEPVMTTDKDYGPDGEWDG